MAGQALSQVLILWGELLKCVLCVCAHTHAYIMDMSLFSSPVFHELLYISQPVIQTKKASSPILNPIGVSSSWLP